MQRPETLPYQDAGSALPPRGAQLAAVKFFNILFCLPQRLQEKGLHGFFGGLEFRLAHAQVVENGAVKACGIFLNRRVAPPAHRLNDLADRLSLGGVIIEAERAAPFQVRRE